jgi:hypothetical protein
MFLTELFSSPFASAAVAAVGVLLSVATYFLGRWSASRTLSAKYRDRLYDLNKLTVQSGDVALAFFDPGNHTGHYFDPLYNMTPGASAAAAPNPLTLIAQVRAYVHYRLNFYEEIFYATKPLTMQVFEDSSTWRSYVSGQIADHPLVKELLTRDKAKFGWEFIEFAGV